MVSRLFLLIPVALFLATATEHPARVAGIYEGIIAVKNADGRRITLTLQQDGTGELRDGAKRASGHWSATETQLRVEVDGKPEPMLWRVKGNTLTLEREDRKEYGKKGLVLRRPR